MRGPDEQTQHMFSYLLPEQRVPADHPLRAIRALTDEALRSMSAQLARLYSTTGRPSGARGGPALRRALHRGRHPTGSLGESEELPPAHGAGGAASRRPRQSDGQFPRRAPAQRHAPVDDGPAGAAVSEGLGTRGDPGVSRMVQQSGRGWRIGETRSVRVAAPPVASGNARHFALPHTHGRWLGEPPPGRRDRLSPGGESGPPGATWPTSTSPDRRPVPLTRGARPETRPADSGAGRRHCHA